LQEIDLKSAIETNVLKLGALTMEAFNDRLLVIEDEFRSGYECRMCLKSQAGIGWLVCENCGGTGASVIVKDGKCSHCDGVGRVLCQNCKGKGVEEGGLVIPDASSRRPTTGIVVSIGDKTERVQRGESVIYTSFSGHVYDLELPNGNIVVIRVIQESDILAKVSGHLELRRVKKSAAVGSAA
jgi:co-chaperonin GroES (HSP10)